MKKRRKAERGQAGKHNGFQPRSAATTSDDRALQGSEAKFRSLIESKLGEGSTFKVKLPFIKP